MEFELSANWQQKVYSVIELTLRIKDLLERQIGEVAIEGEISNLREQSSGHLYFTLKDASAQISVVMFRSDAARIGWQPRDGQQVIVRGEVTVYAPRGNYQLRALSMRLKGKGTLQEQFEALKRKLAAEGLFDASRKKELPRFPEKVGIVTSASGAALQDFLNILKRRSPHIHVYIYDVRVQGAGSAQQIADAIDALNELHTKGLALDLIVLARGGGSLEDLWSFNEEIVARAISASELPVISAVGHEIDFTIADFVADLRAPTPSAAAELLSRSREDWLQDLNKHSHRLNRAVQTYFSSLRWRLQAAANHYVFREPRKIILQWFQTLDDKELRMQRAMQHFLARKNQLVSSKKIYFELHNPMRTIEKLRTHLNHQTAKLKLLSPQTILERGYVMALDREGKVISSANQARIADEFSLRFYDDTLPVKVESGKENRVQNKK